jgi:hypothetical protein
MPTECDNGKILNPKTKRCVNIDGAIGRTILADIKSRKSASRRKSPSRKSASRKSASRKSPSRKSASRKSASRKSSSRKSSSRKSSSRRKSASHKSSSRKNIDLWHHIEMLRVVCSELSEKADLRFDKEITDFLATNLDDSL